MRRQGKLSRYRGAFDAFKHMILTGYGMGMTPAAISAECGRGFARPRLRGGRRIWKYPSPAAVRYILKRELAYFQAVGNPIPPPDART